MIYKKFQDIELSALGFGTMRLPVLDGDNSKIDEEKTFEMFDYAMKNGVNYYDTAWGYHDEMSEIVVGKALKRYPRDSFYVSTKFPGYDLSNMPKAEEIFEKQLEKLQMDYFDFYLIHNVNEMNVDAYLDPKFGILDYFVKQKELGRIKHLGFSAHGVIPTMEKFFKVYGPHMEFCQIQLNYVDYFYQDAKGKIDLINKYNIPVWVMEPLRGGKLANVSEVYEKRLTALRGKPVTEMAFRFLQSIPEVTMTLSGMSDMEQMKANIETYKTDEPLNEAEMKEVCAVAKDMIAEGTVPCTACRYCTSYCTKELDIPRLIGLYNDQMFLKLNFMTLMGLAAIDKAKHPDACVACKKCEQVCPQNIKISEVMKKFADMIPTLKME